MTDGLRQIVRFNWPFYAVATTVVTAAGPLIARLPVTIGIRSFLYSATGLAGFWIAGSLAASWIVYDRSRLTEWEWIRDALGFRPLAWLNIHAGLDESTPIVRRLLAPSHGRVFDIFDPVEMTEPSIARARRLALGRSPPRQRTARRRRCSRTSTTPRSGPACQDRSCRRMRSKRRSGDSRCGASRAGSTCS